MLKPKLEAFIPQQLAWKDFSQLLEKLDMTSMNSMTSTKQNHGYAKDLLRFCAVELQSRIDGGLGRALKSLAAARNRLEPQLPKHLHWQNLTSLILELNDMPSFESFQKLLACHPDPLKWALKQMKRKILSYLPGYWPEILEDFRLNVHQVLEPRLRNHDVNLCELSVRMPFLDLIREVKALTEPLLREALEAQDTPLARDLLIEKQRLEVKRTDMLLTPCFRDSK